MLDDITPDLREEMEMEIALENKREHNQLKLMYLFEQYGGEENSRIMEYDIARLLYRSCFKQTAFFKDSKQAEQREELLVLGYQKVVEELLALESEGLYEVDDTAHRDWTDGTEGKSAGIRIKKKSDGDGGYKIYFGWEITNVKTEYSGTTKEGDLRVVMPNIFNQTVRYFFLPKDEWDGENEWYKESSRSITGEWDPVTNRMRLIRQNTDIDLRDYEVASFSELAKTPATR